MLLVVLIGVAWEPPLPKLTGLAGPGRDGEGVKEGVRMRFERQSRGEEGTDASKHRKNNLLGRENSM